MKLIFALSIICCSLLVASQLPELVNKYPTEKDPLPTELDLLMNDQPSLPKYAEGGYSPLGRSPVVDAVLGDPFYLPSYVKKVASALRKMTDKTSLFQVSSACFKAGGIPITDIRWQKGLEDEAVPEKFETAFTKKTGSELYRLWRAFLQVSDESKELLSVLSVEEKQWLKANYEAFFFGEQGRDDYEFFTTESVVPFKFFTMGSKLNLAKLTDCALKLALIVDQVYQMRGELSQVILDNDFVWEESGRKFFVSSKSDSSFTDNADFALHTGQRNLYYNNAGGNEGTMPAALQIDLQGSHSYIGGNFTQGSGFLGVGLLACFSGDNHFNADSYSQGAGFFGVGVLSCRGDNNKYEMNLFGQSAAAFGASLLWNTGSHTSYIAHEGLAQAASSTLGVAFLVNDGGFGHFKAGELGHAYKRRAGIGQGASIGVRMDPWRGNPSLYGGVSFLYSRGGNNSYENSWFAQGSSYFLGLGVLVDEGDNGKFLAEVDAQGQGLHLAAGMLLHKGGNSVFNGGWGSLGVGGDRSVGMFISTGGGNQYTGTIQSIGSSRKPKAIGLFIDLQGGSNYVFQSSSNADIQQPASPLEWSRALFLTYGGNNQYSQNVDQMKRGPNLIWGIPNYSFGIDRPLSVPSEALTKQLFNRFPKYPRVPFPFNPIKGYSENTAFYPLKNLSKENLDAEIKSIINESSYDKRRAIYESIDLYRFTHPEAKIDLTILLDDPANAPEDQFNYAAMWAVQTSNPPHIDLIIEALKQEQIASSYSRKFAIKLITTFALNRSPELLAKLMQSDPSEENRAMATFFLAKVNTTAALELLKPALSSEFETVRYCAAAGLQESPLAKEALQLLVPLFDDSSFYVRRAAAMAAISLHDKAGIPVLLETLDHHTLDTTDNYGDNIYNKLAYYVGVDFGVDKDAWLAWWKSVHETFEFPK